MINIAT